MWKILLFLLLAISSVISTYLLASSRTMSQDETFVFVLFASCGSFLSIIFWFLLEIPDEFSKQRNAINCHIFVIKRKTMEILKKFKNFFLLNARDKRFMKLGIVNSNNELTEEGREVYNSWRFEKDRDEFDKEVAQKLEKK